MQTLKSVFGVIGALVPIVYCGYLLYYFLDLSGSVQQAQTDGLGPTLLGLAIVGLLCCIPLIVRIVRIFGGPRLPGSGGRGGPDPLTRESEGSADADAVVARYVASRSTEDASGVPVAPRLRRGDGPMGRRPSFGRRKS